MSATEKFELDGIEIADASRRLARRLGGTPRRPRRLVVGGVPSVALAVDGGDEAAHRVIIAGMDLTVTADFRFPRREAAGYEAHMETMLATWRWG